MNSRCAQHESGLWDLVECGVEGADPDLARHVASCAHCGKRLAEMRRLCTALESLGEEAHGPLPDRIGDYRILRLIGEGGMGIVYEAEQAAPRRRVALKVMRAWTNDVRGRQRFRREIEALGRLDHPGISRIHDAGKTEFGQPWFVMELVEGRALDAHCARKKLSLHDRLVLFRQVLDAVAAAHARGIVHRDLKPANIIVDGEAQVRVLDFGLAQMRGEEFEVGLTLTGMGPCGTLPYMSPEQVKGPSRALDERTDVYSLGVVLYELLTGRLPYAVEGALSAGIRTIVESPPVPPARVAKVSPALEAIILTCLAKNPSDRFSSVDAMAEELDRHLAGQVVRVRRPRDLSRGGRRRLATGLAAATFLVALIVLACAGPRNWGFSPLRPEADAPSSRQIGHEAPEILGGPVSPDGRLLAYTNWDTGNLRVRHLGTDETWPITTGGTWEGDEAWAEGPVWSADGKWLAFAWQAHPLLQIRVGDSRGSATRVVWEGEAIAWPRGWSHDGLILTVLRGTLADLVVLPLDGGEVRRLQTWEPSHRRQFAASPDGRHLLVSGPAEGDWERIGIRIVDLESGEMHAFTNAGPHRMDQDAVWSPQGDYVLFVSDRSWSLDLWARRVHKGRAAGPAVLVRAEIGGALPIRFLDDGTLLLATNPRDSDIWTAPLTPDGRGLAAEPTRIPTSYPGRNARPVWSPDGRRLIFVSRRGERRGRELDCVIVDRELATGEEREMPLPFPFTFGGPGGVPPRLSPDGQTFALIDASVSRRLQLLPLGGEEARPLLDDACSEVIWSADGRLLYCLQGSERPTYVVRVDVASGAVERLAEVGFRRPGGRALSPDERRLAVAERDGIRIIELGPSSGDRWVRSVPLESPWHLQWHEDLLYYSVKGEVFFLDPDHATPEAHPLGLDNSKLRDLAIHPDGDRLVFRGAGPGRERRGWSLFAFDAEVREALGARR